VVSICGDEDGGWPPDTAHVRRLAGIAGRGHRVHPPIPLGRPDSTRQNQRDSHRFAERGKMAVQQEPGCKRSTSMEARIGFS